MFLKHVKLSFDNTHVALPESFAGGVALNQGIAQILCRYNDSLARRGHQGRENLLAASRGGTAFGAALTRCVGVRNDMTMRS